MWCQSSTQIATCCQMSTECFKWVDGNSSKLEVSTGDAKLCLCDNENPPKGFRIFETSHNWTNAYSSEMLKNYTTANIQIPLHPNELSAFISIHAITRFLPREISSPSGLCMSLASWDISMKDCTVSTFILFTDATITVHKVVHVFIISDSLYHRGKKNITRILRKSLLFQLYITTWKVTKTLWS